jgi:GMP synthase (glutamine-hydrolysing)
MVFQPQQFLAEAQKQLVAALPQGRAVVACSGGVDSTVCAVLAHRALGARAHMVFLDTGFMRAGEAEAVRSALGTLGIPLEVVPCAARFFAALRGVRDPEEKRRRFRAAFYTVLAEILAAKGAQALVQGTIAADVQETQARVKTHHNVLDGVADGLPPDVLVLEPLRGLLKPEVRALARHLGLPQEFVARRPFPGPGLAIRVAGEVTPERVDLLRRATKVVEEETADLPAFQAFPILLEEQATGVREGTRVLGPALVLRGVTSENALSARVLPIPWERLTRLVDRLLGELPEVGRVLYDLTPKPPATVEWE